MSPIIPQVVTEGGTKRLHTHQESRENRRKGSNNNNAEGRSTKYSEDLRSRFGTAFLPYASQLESVEKVRTIRKRKGKNKRKKPVKITTIGEYKVRNKKKAELYEKQTEENNNKRQKK